MLFNFLKRNVLIKFIVCEDYCHSRLRSPILNFSSVTSISEVNTAAIFALICRHEVGSINTCIGESVAVITDYMEQSASWEADSHSTNQEIPRLLWKPEVHYSVHKSLQISRPCITFRNALFFCGKELFGLSPNLQAARSPPVGCSRLLLQYFISYPPYLQPEDTPCPFTEFHSVE